MPISIKVGINCLGMKLKANLKGMLIVLKTLLLELFPRITHFFRSHYIPKPLHSKRLTVLEIQLYRVLRLWKQYATHTHRQG